jgi:hypothetical protein
MRKIKTIMIDEREITVKELTVADVRDLLENVTNKTEINTIDLLFGDSVPSEAIEKSTGIKIKKLENDFSPSEIKTLVEAVEEVNPFFVAMIQKLKKATENLKQAQ